MAGHRSRQAVAQTARLDPVDRLLWWVLALSMLAIAGGWGTYLSHPALRALSNQALTFDEVQTLPQ